MSTSLVQERAYADFCAQRLGDPYPLFARLRTEDPIHWCAPMKMWLVTRYDDVHEGLRETERLSNSRESMYTDPLRPENRARARPLVEHLGHWLLNVDAPHHTRLRRLVNVAFTPRMLRAVTPRIEQTVATLLDDVCASPEVDLIERFCLPLPAIVICDMLGVPASERDRFRDGVARLLPFSSAGGPGLNDHIDEARRGLASLIELFEGLIEQRRRAPTDDLLSALASAEADGDRLSSQELFAMCVFLFLAGHETTMGFLASGMLALLQHPEQFARLRADPDGLVDGAVEEFLRYEPPVTRGVRRAKVDFTWRDRSIRKGQTITMLIGGANRDPEQFPDPDRLDIGRQPNRHLAFGFGGHFCLGAPLARLEGQIAFRAIARRCPPMTLMSDQFAYQPAMGIRSLMALPVRFDESGESERT